MELDQFIELCRKRYSCRHYKAQPIPRPTIEGCVKAADLAPSAHNSQPCRFIGVEKKEMREKIFDECMLPGYSMKWILEAPLMLVLAAEKELLTHKVAPLASKIDFAPLDVGIAAEHFVLAAAAQGLGTCWVGWVNAKKLKKVLSLPLNYQVFGFLTCGYPATDEIPQKKRNGVGRMLSWY